MSKGFILYHVASSSAAAAILLGGFVDGEGKYGTERKLRGVFLSNRALDTNEGVRSSGDIVLAVTFVSMPLSDLDEYELAEDGKSYREWCIPASVVQRRATVQIAETDDGVAELPGSAGAEIRTPRRQASGLSPSVWIGATTNNSSADHKQATGRSPAGAPDEIEVNEDMAIGRPRELSGFFAIGLAEGGLTQGDRRAMSRCVQCAAVSRFSASRSDRRASPYAPSPGSRSEKRLPKT